MPLWNFFKILDTGDLRYLIVRKDRIDYELIKQQPTKQQVAVWDKVLDQFNNLENTAGLSYHIRLRDKLIFRWALYVEEQAMVKSLMFKTNVQYIRLLRQRGYQLANNQIQYWQDLVVASRRVHYHLSQMELIKAEIERSKGSEPVKDNGTGDTFFKIVAWFNSRGIQVSDNITVSHYVQLKKLLQKQIAEKSKQYGRART